MSKGGGAAFPVQGFGTRNGQGVEVVYEQGMTLRDYFAAKAMQALIAVETADNTMEADLWAPHLAYEIADAMLAERAK
jgi:hypothetical protein